MRTKTKQTRGTKTVKGTCSTRVEVSSVTGPSLADKNATFFEYMEESRNDRIQVALANHLKKSGSAPQSQ